MKSKKLVRLTVYKKRVCILIVMPNRGHTLSTADRFTPISSLSAAELKERIDRYHFQNITAKQLRPLLSRRFRPVLKQHGFQRANDALSFRLTASPYVHFVSVSFSSKFPGRFQAKAGIALDFLPIADNITFDAKKVCLDSDCLFTTHLVLPNGNPEFDNGRSEAEANETIDMLLNAFTQFDESYFQKKFSRFPTPLDRLGVRFVEKLARLVEKDEESQYGGWGATDTLFVYRLALIHRHLGKNSEALSLVEYGLSKLSLYSLKPLYDKLRRELKKLNASETA
jgi:hypothetical protein